ncbi:DALR anticodon binding domain protein [Richelia sinica FACHB-800]|uniref:DALR anticodon binding domain protein n=1 Tax=Richelia sinica FACHB-800 TaxID=1357546 RepID=A0A975TC39_9NOST|nr:hypothetical protein [Richelia sinica]MBD2666664.1 hypothetical protein [Richelia sinica FACHB-800]QXE25283.1 DALR anticodon binding domain protein [Richelia sinica FACHB-800]
MHQSLLFPNYTSIKQLINSYLLKTLSVYTSDRAILSIGSTKVPLYLDGDGKKIIYISSMAMRMATSHISPLETARAIASHFSRGCEGLFTVKTDVSGKIYIELIHSTLANWLQNFTQGSVPWEIKETIVKSSHDVPIIFQMQYVHARCYSILRLSLREELINLCETSINTNSCFPSFVTTQPIPWLNSEQQLCLQQPEEMALIQVLLKIVDDWVCPPSDRPIKWEQAGVKLAQAWEKFSAHCRIWGEVRINSPNLSQARLGLLIMTQLVLKAVLEEKLGVIAPIEL